MSTEEIAQPPPVPPKDQATTDVPEVKSKRLSIYLNKAKVVVNDTFTEVQKAIQEKKVKLDQAKVEKKSKEADEPKTEKKEDNIKVLLNRIKSIHKPSTSAQPATEIDSSPVPPPKDNVDSSTSKSPIVEQLKRNTTLISNYLIQKKNEFSQKKATTTSNENTTEVIDGEPAKKEHSPLVRRITKLVNTATTTINKNLSKTKEPNTTEKVSETTESPASTPVVITA